MIVKNRFATIIIFFVLLALCMLSWRMVSGYLKNQTENSIEELQNNKQSIKKDSANTNSQKSRAVMKPPESSLPLVLNTKSISEQINKERIAQAREAYEKGPRREKIQALHLIMNISPADASAILSDLLASKEKTEESLALIRHLMSGLSDEKAYLQDSVVKTIYSLNDPIAQKIAAIILEDRGDISLRTKYLDSRKSKLASDDASERRIALEEIASVGFSAANELFVKALEDSDSNIKIRAIEHLKNYGNNTNIAALEKLLQDKNPSVVEQTQTAINSLWNKTTNDELSLTERLMQPGFPVNGLVPD